MTDCMSVSLQSSGEEGRAGESGLEVARARESEAAVEVPLGRGCMLSTSSCAGTFAEGNGMRKVVSMCDSEERESAVEAAEPGGVNGPDTNAYEREPHGTGTNGPLGRHVSIQMSVVRNQDVRTVVSCELLCLPASFRAKGWSFQRGGFESGCASVEVCPFEERVECGSVDESSASCSLHRMERHDSMSQEQEHSVALKHVVERNAVSSSCSSNRRFEGSEDRSQARTGVNDTSECAFSGMVPAGNILGAGNLDWLTQNGTGLPESQPGEFMQEHAAGRRLAELLQRRWRRGRSRLENRISPSSASAGARLLVRRRSPH